MSKQSDAKAAQGYQDKPIPSTCANCQQISVERALPAWMEREKALGRKAWNGRAFSIELDGIEKNLRCTMGGFAVKKMATCNQFVSKPPAA